MKLDVLAIGAHPDDADLGVGGLVLKLTGRGLTVGILDLTRGELGTRGTPEERAAEAREAARRLGVTVRENAGLPDGAVQNNREQQRAVIEAIRKHRPKILLAPMGPDRHPDHTAAHALVRDANFFAGLERLESGRAPYRAPKIYHYFSYHEPETAPSFVVDISAHFDAKREALRAYASQFHNPGYEGGATLISSQAFWDGIEKRAAYWGHRIGAAYGEPLYTEGPAPLDIPPELGDAG